MPTGSGRIRVPYPMCGTKITKVPHHQQLATSGLLRSASRAPAGRRTRSGMHTHDFPGGKERWEPHFHCRRYVVRVSSMRWLLLARHCYERGLHGRSGRSLDSVGSVSSEMGEHSLEKHSLGSAFWLHHLLRAKGCAPLSVSLHTR